jgi:hypothetical protein
MSVRAGSGSRQLLRAESWMLLAFLALAVLVGGLVPQVIAPLRPLALSPAAAVLILAFIIAVPYLLKNWRVMLGVFLVWLVLEDLFRKLAGNDLWIYFAKDVAFLILLLGLFLDPGFRERWRAATGATRFVLYALVAWALIMSVPSWWVDPRLPFIGLRLDFMYAPLVAAGFAIGSRGSSMRWWLLFAASVGAGISLIGVIQATIGPSFLSPGTATPGLIHLELFRGIDSSVYRPTATFVDPGRFAAFAVLGFAVSLAAFVMSRGGKRILALTCAIANAAGIWVSGGRAGLVVGVLLVAFAAMAGPLVEGRLAPGRAVGMLAGIVLAGVFLTALLPGVVGARLRWYSETLDPRSSLNEWSFRADAAIENTGRALRIGGLFGQGTGTESLGKQYLTGDSNQIAGLYQVEGGYASIAVELGAVGVALWLAWSIGWTVRQWRSIKAGRGHRPATGAFVLFCWMLSFLFYWFVIGFQGFQNYVANAYFWLLSGVMFAVPFTATDPYRIADRPSPVDVAT